MRGPRLGVGTVHERGQRPVDVPATCNRSLTEERAPPLPDRPHVVALRRVTLCCSATSTGDTTAKTRASRRRSASRGETLTACTRTSPTLRSVSPTCPATIPAGNCADSFRLPCRLRIFHLQTGVDLVPRAPAQSCARAYTIAIQSGRRITVDFPGTRFANVPPRSRSEP